MECYSIQEAECLTKVGYHLADGQIEVQSYFMFPHTTVSGHLTKINTTILITLL